MNDFLSQFRRLNEDIIILHNKNETPYITFPHLHSQYEIYYNINGAKGFMLNGDFFRCNKHDLIVIPKVHTHKVLVKKNVEYERCIINVSDYVIELIELLCHSQDTLSWLKGTNESIPHIVTLSPGQHEKFLKFIHLYNRYELQKDHLRALSTFIRLLSFLKKCFENKKITECINEDELSYPDKIMKNIEQTFKTATVSEIAESLFINVDYANRIFKEETGITIKKYLTMRKIAEAKKYLFLGKSTKEACVLSGFRDYSNFIRTFRNYGGYSPKELMELSEPI